MAAPLALGIDIGGTNIKIGLCNRQGQVVGRDEIRTEVDRGYADCVLRIAGMASSLLRKTGTHTKEVHAVGVGAPGPMSHAQGIIYKAPNLPDWENVRLRDDLSRAIALPVTLENDANAAAFGEFAAGAGRDVQDMIMLTLGTGIGGGVIIGGRLIRGTYDTAGEIGHMIVVPNGRACPCGQRGCLERYSSANAIAERSLEAIRAGEASALSALGAKFAAEDVQTAAHSGDALAARIWDEACLYLAICCANLQHLLNPELIVLAGGLIHAGDRLLSPLRQHFEAQSWKIAPDSPAIEFAKLGTDAGIVGAAMLAFES